MFSFLRKSIGLLTIFILCGCVLRAQNNNCFAVQTKIDNGVIEGLYDVKSTLQFYLGIPYAKPPLNDLRWKAPQPIDSWNGVKETKKFGPRAVQGLIYGDMDSRSNGISEDCLYLNVWTPAKRNTTNLPVLVYFYGGGLIVGDGSEPRYDGASMAKKGIVVVTVNYRLNVFGFLAHPELTAEAPYKASGNYGYLDQNAALKWVNKNIAAFGGDPKKVIIAGESAGSISVSVQMSSPLSKSLIAGAIGESGAAIFPTYAPVQLAVAEQIGVAFTQKSGNLSIKQLREMSVREVYELYNEYIEAKGVKFPAVIDGYLLPQSLPQIFKAKEQAQVPLLLGWNTVEHPSAVFMQGLPATSDNYIAKVKEAYPLDFNEVLRFYPCANAQELENSATTLASDRFMAFCTWKWSDLHVNNSSQPVYRYLFSRIRPPMVNQTPAGRNLKKDNMAKATVPMGAPHASEIEYCMGNLDLSNKYGWTDEDYVVSETMHNYFANFIKTGNPNGANLPMWPTVQPQDLTPNVMVIDVVSKSVKAENDARLRFLDKVYSR